MHKKKKKGLQKIISRIIDHKLKKENLARQEKEEKKRLSGQKREKEKDDKDRHKKTKKSKAKDAKEESLEKKLKHREKSRGLKDDDYIRKQRSEYFRGLEYKKGLDYESLFSYIGSGKVSYSDTEKIEFSESISTSDSLTNEKIDNIMKRKMLSEMVGGIRDFTNIDEEEKYRRWKKFNQKEWWWKARFINNDYGARDIVGSDFYTI